MWKHWLIPGEAYQVAARLPTPQGEKLDNMATVGLGVEAKLTKETTFGLSYTESFDGEITSHGVSANWRINF